MAIVYQLIRRQGDFPPGGYQYTDARTGMTFDGNGGFDFTVQAILQHRRANKKLYPPEDLKELDVDYVSTILDEYTCNRLKNSSNWCKRSDGVVILPSAASGEIEKLKSPCPNCGNDEGRVKYCATCAGKRILGHYCTQCNFLIGA